MFPMLRFKVLVNILNKISDTPGIDDVVILNNTGEVLAYNGKDEKNFVDVICAISSNMWLMLETTGESAINEEQLNYVLIKCVEGKIFMSRIADFLLCIRAKESVGFGLLKKNSLLLKQYCEQPLKQAKEC